MRSTNNSTARLEARISKELYATLRRAAELQEPYHNDFVISGRPGCGPESFEQTEVLRLSLEDQERFAEALLSPPKLPLPLKRAFARHRKWLNDRRLVCDCFAR